MKFTPHRFVFYFLFSFIWHANAENIYVSNSTELASACSNANSGDVIFISSGIYTGPLILSNKSNVTLKSYNGAVYIEGSPSPSTTGIIQLEIYNSNTISIQNLVFRNNWGNFADGIKIHGNGGTIRISDCEFYKIGWTTGKTTMPDPGKSAHAIVVVGSSPTPIRNVYIGNNTIHDCITGYSESVTLVGNVEHFLVEGNTLNSNTNIGIDAAGHFSWTGAPAELNYARSGIIKDNIVSNYAGPTGLDAASGIYIDGGSYNLIENNIVSNYKVGFSIGCEVPGNVANGNILRSNLAYNCSLSGLFLGSNTTSAVHNSEIQNNTFYKCGNGTFDNGQIALQNNSGSIIKNNILYPTNDRFAMVQMNGTTSSDKIQSYNLYWRDSRNTSNLFYNIVGDTNAITQNPLFINSDIANFRIDNSSPAVNAGDPSYTTTNQLDLDGNSRVQGSRVDIGAFETDVPLQDNSTEITIDGNINDWSEVHTITTNGSGGLSNIKIVDNSEHIYILVTGNMNIYSQVFLDTDNSTTAGGNEYLGFDWPSTGFDVMIENGELFTHNGQGANWSWTRLGTIDFAKTESFLELGISKSSLEVSSIINVAAKMINANWSPSGYIPTIGETGASYTLGSGINRLEKSNNNVDLERITFYPNPLHNRINIAIPLSQLSRIEVKFYDIQGKQVGTTHSEMKSNNDQVVSIDISEYLRPGLYIAKVTIDGKNYANKLITVTK